MKPALLIFLLCLTILSASNGWAQEDAVIPSADILTTEEPEAAPEEAEAAIEGTEAVAETGPVHVNNKICPVSGEKVGTMGEGATREYNGRIYSFCCSMCLNDFDLDPEKYVAIVEEMKAKEDAEGGGADEEMSEPAVD